MPPIRILIADDHTLMRQGLRQLGGRQGGFTVVGEAVTGAQAVALARDARPDVILMDIVMPELDGVEAIRQIVREAPGTRIIALTMYREEPYMLAAIRAGARGYLLKPVDAGDLVAAIEPSIAVITSSTRSSPPVCWANCTWPCRTCRESSH